MAELVMQTARAETFNYKRSNISGRRFNRLTALYPTKLRDERGYVVWHCRCDCGREVDVTYNQLAYGNMKSCGCRKKEHDAELEGYLGRTNGTAVAMLKSRKMFANNSTGYRGVYRVKGKYAAKIVFQKKQYGLGLYETAEQAAAVRKRAEDVLFVGFAEYYERWTKRAEADPAWAAENPIEIAVNKDASEVYLSIRPEL